MKTCGGGLRRGGGPAATPLIRPLAWEHPYAAGGAQKKKKKKKKKKKGAVKPPTDLPLS